MRKNIRCLKETKELPMALSSSRLAVDTSTGLGEELPTEPQVTAMLPAPHESGPKSLRGTEDLHGLQTLKTPLSNKILLVCLHFFLGQRLLGALSQIQNLTHSSGLGNWPGHLLQALIDSILRDIPLSLLPRQNHPPSTLLVM